jgi:hypothetical protein
MKANMIIVRGLNGKEIRGEDWGKVEHETYMTLPPKRMEKTDAFYDVVLLVPGKEPTKFEGIIYRGCNCIAIPAGVSQYL